MSRHARAPRRVGAALARVEGREKVTGPGALRRTSTDAEGVVLRRGRAGDGRHAARSARSTPARRWRCPACSPCCRTGTRRALADDDDRELAVLQCDRRRLPRPDRRRGRRRDASRPRARPPRSCASSTTQEPHDVVLDAPTTRGSTRPSKVNPRFRDRHRARRRRRGASPAAAVDRRRDLQHAGASTTTRWSRTPRSALWRRRRPDAATTPPRARRRRATRSRKALRARARAQVRVISPHVGGGFGSKGTPRPHVDARGDGRAAHVGRPVKLALTRQQMFAVAGYRTPTIQRMRLGADARRAPDGDRARASSSRRSTLKEFAEQTAVRHAA